MSPKVTTIKCKTNVALCSCNQHFAWCKISLWKTTTVSLLLRFHQNRISFEVCSSFKLHSLRLGPFLVWKFSKIIYTLFKNKLKIFMVKFLLLPAKVQIHIHLPWILFWKSFHLNAKYAVSAFFGEC